MTRTTVLLAFLLVASFAHGQGNVLLLQKRGKTQETFFQGKYIAIQTRQGNFASGIITNIRADSLFLRYFDIEQSTTQYGGIFFDTVYKYSTAIHYNDIGAFIDVRRGGGRRSGGTLLMIAGGGVLALGAVNGIYRGDPPRDWYTTTSYISAGALTGLGLLMKRPGTTKRVIGKKYSLKILPLGRR